MNNRILILGSLGEFVQLVKMARERGIFTIVCDGNTDGPAKKYADKAYHTDVRDTRKIAEICIKEEVDGILTAYSDLLLECMVDIAAAAGIGCYLRPEQAVFYRNKHIMKQMFQTLGIGSPKFARLSSDFEDCELEDMSFPLVIKPVDKYGSRGVMVVDSISEIRKSFDESCADSGLKEILAEEYNDGYEFNMMAWVNQGKVTVLGIADREKTDIGKHKIPISTRNVYPSCLMEYVYEDAKKILEQIVSYTGQQDGELSMQFFWDFGRKIEVCEVAARFLGYEHELIEYCSGVSLEELMLCSVYDKETLIAKLEAFNPYFKVSSAVLYFQGREKVIADMKAAEDCQQQPFVMNSSLFYQKGEKVTEFERPYVARFVVKADTRAEVDSLTDILYDDMSILDDNGAEILYQNRRQIYEKI